MDGSIMVQPNSSGVTAPVKKIDFPGELTVAALPNLQVSSQAPGNVYESRTETFQIPIYLEARPHLRLLNDKLELFVKPQAAVSVNGEKIDHKVFQWGTGIKAGLIYTINPNSVVKVSPEISVGASHATGNFSLMSPYYYKAAREEFPGRLNLNFALGRGFRLTPYGEYRQIYSRDDETYTRDSLLRFGLNGVLAFSGSEPGKLKAVPNLHFDFGVVAWGDYYAETTELSWTYAVGGMVVTKPIDNHTSFKPAGSDLTLALSWDKLPYIIPSLCGGVSSSSHDNGLQWVSVPRYNPILGNTENVSEPKYQDSFPIHYWFGLGLNLAPAINKLIKR